MVSGNLMVRSFHVRTIFWAICRDGRCTGAAILLVLCFLSVALTALAVSPQRVVFRVGQREYVVGDCVRQMDVVPFLVDGRMYVPVRYFAHALGVETEDLVWAGESGAVTLWLEGTVIQLKVGSRRVYVNGEPKELDFAPVLKDGRIYFPVRFLAEAFGYEVRWDKGLCAVLIERPLPLGKKAPKEDTPRTFTFPEEASFDVVVVGAEPEGIAAAVSAAKQGVSVLLVDHRDKLGGLYTLGWLNYIDMNYGPAGELVTAGTFAQFYHQVGSVSFDVNKAERVFKRMIARYPNVLVSLNTKVVGVLVSEGVITGLKVQSGPKISLIRACRVIDATQDGDIAVMAGAPYTVGAEDMGEPSRRQCVTLVFRLKDVSWERLKEAASKGLVKGAVFGRIAWGFEEVAKKYRPSTPRLRLRGLNIGLQSDNTVLINALQIFDVDGLDPQSRFEARELALEELPLIVSHLQKHLPGFERAVLDGIAPELYVRETRHIQCLYQLDVNDVVFNRDFPDRVAIGSYPVDIQATSPANPDSVYGKPKMYAIPLRSLVPKKVDNLLVVGRAAGYTHLAAGSARVVPVGMAAGDAAGAAAAFSLKINKTVHALVADQEVVKKVQEILRKQGAYLEPVQIDNPLAGHWAFPALEFVNRWGLICAGYENDWGLGKPLGKAAMYDMVATAMRRALPEKYQASSTQHLKKEYATNEPIKRGEAARLLLRWLGSAPDDPREAVRIAREKGLLPVEHVGDDPQEHITGAEAYYGIHRLYLRFQGK